MLRKLLVVIFLFGITPLFADEGGNNAQFVWMKEPSVATSFNAQVGFGLLDNKKGSPVYNLFGLHYALNSNLEFSLALPLAGTISTLNDSYGIGNIVIGTKYVFQAKSAQIGVGVDVALPSATSASFVGVFYRPLELFFDHQTAISPYVVLAYKTERLTLSADLGTNIQIFDSVGNNTEMILFYDAGTAFSIYDNIWATVEFNGYSTTTYPSNHTGLFAGPGIRYQDHEMSAGFHLIAPFRTPERNVYDFMGIFDVRVFF